MGRLNRLLSLPADEKLLYLRTWGYVWYIRLLLWLPYKTWRRIIASKYRASLTGQSLETQRLQRTVRAVKVAARFVPRASCLTQAITAQILLARLGQASHMQIGVAQTTQGEFVAHAWVEVDGRVVIGGRQGLSRFTVMPKFEMDQQ